MGAFNRILLHQQLVITKPIDAIISKLYKDNANGFNVKRLDDGTYKLLAKVSFGTGNSGLIFDGIKVHLMLTRDGENTVLTFTTRLRFELIFLMLLEGIFIVGQLSLKTTNILLWTLGIVPVCVLWFWAVYRYQENSLVTEAEEYLTRY